MSLLRSDSIYSRPIYIYFPKLPMCVFISVRFFCSFTLFLTFDFPPSCSFSFFFLSSRLPFKNLPKPNYFFLQFGAMPGLEPMIFCWQGLGYALAICVTDLTQVSVHIRFCNSFCIFFFSSPPVSQIRATGVYCFWFAHTQKSPEY